MMKIKVLMIGPYRESKGGITDVVNTVLNQEIQNTDIKYIGLSDSQSKNAVKVFQFLISLGKVILTLLFYQPHIIHVHSSSRASFIRKSIIVRVAILFKKKVIFHVHSGEFIDYYKQLNDKMKLYLLKTLLMVDRVIVLTPKWQKKFEEEFGLKNVEVVPNPIDTKKYKAKAVNLHTNEYKILFMGKMIKLKGIYDILYAIPSISSKIPNISFVFCGDIDEKEKERFQDTINKLGIKKFVLYKGWLAGNEKLKELNSASILLLPSYKEAFGKVLLEGMCSGIPIVASNVGGIPDVIKDGRNGFLIEPGNIQELVNAILALTQDKNLYKDIYQNNLIDVKEYTVEIITKQLLDTYKEVYNV
ncbi:glycosyltransferase family 4 protein [Metabacillus niabensis]|uniref:glycosyltransferase family 4 protein n=1 Tax=Metabacillus niabensis TaxID=324854 RepID=UPI0039A0D669